MTQKTTKDKKYSTPYVIYWPEKQKNHHYIDQESLACVYAFLPPESYGVYHIDYRKEKKIAFAFLASLFAHDCGEYVSMMHFGEHQDFYISKNPVRNMNRSSETLKSLTNIVFDLDDHKRKRTPEEYKALCERTLTILWRDLFYDGIVPVPSWAVYTGRGIQLHWNLISNVAYESYIKKYEAVVDNWLKSFRDCLRECGEDTLDIDCAASTNKAGFVRLPGSFNTKAGVYTYAEMMSGMRYDLHALYDTVCAHMPAPMYRGKTNRHSLVGLGRGRCNMIEQLRRLRTSVSDIGTRNNMCFVYFSSACMFTSREEARALTERFNTGFVHPLNPSELRSTISTAYRHANDEEKCYKLTNEKIMDLLAISPDEQRKLDFYTTKRTPRGKNAARDERRAKKREALCRAARKLWHKGYTAYKIAKELGIDYRTAQKRVAEFRAAEEKKCAEKEAKLAKKAAEKEAKIQEQEKAFDIYKRTLDVFGELAFIDAIGFKEKRKKLLRHPDFCKRVKEAESKRWAERRAKERREENRKRQRPVRVIIVDDESEIEAAIKAISDSLKGNEAIYIFGSA